MANSLSKTEVEEFLSEILKVGHGDVTWAGYAEGEGFYLNFPSGHVAHIVVKDIQED